jgi:hypothetical protein
MERTLFHLHVLIEIGSFPTSLRKVPTIKAPISELMTKVSPSMIIWIAKLKHLLKYRKSRTYLKMSLFFEDIINV